MKTPTPVSQGKLPIVIVDTNIFGNLFDKNTSADTLNVVDSLSPKYELAISNITFLEVNAWGSKDVSKILKVLAAFKKFDVDHNVLSFAGLIFCTKKIPGQGDSIIASTCFLNNAFLLTSNQRDFPEPFFHEIDCWHIHHKDIGNRTTTEHIYLLAVDPEEIGKALSSIEYVQELNKKS